jgi:hypothetical protein
VLGRREAPGSVRLVLARLVPVSSRRHPLNVPSPHTPGGSSGLRSRLYTPSVAFAVTAAARLLLFPPAGGVLTRIVR